MLENQQFKTTDAIVMMALLLSAAVVAGRIISSATSDSSVKMAHLQTQKIASQILSGRLEVIQSVRTSVEDRKIASVDGEKIRPLELLGPSGIISQDPWGQPLAYRIWSGANGKTIAIVWSTGPDQRSDTSESDLSRQEKKMSLDGVHFGGDDIGTVLVED
jgi:hypothetical protein